MKNIKDDIFNALSRVFDNMSDQYPKVWADFPTLQYTEEENKVFEHTDEGETKSYVRYRIDIWHNRSTSDAALQVDEILSAFGLVRTLCQDAPDPSGMKHKVMRYEAIIDMENDYIYWPD